MYLHKERKKTLVENEKTFVRKVRWRSLCVKNEKDFCEKCSLEKSVCEK